MNKFKLIKKLLFIKNIHLLTISFIISIIAFLEIFGLGVFQNTIYLLLSEDNQNIGKVSGPINLVLNKMFNSSGLIPTVILFAAIFFFKNILTTFMNYILLSYFQRKHLFLLQQFFEKLIKLDYQNIVENRTKFNQIFSNIDNFIKGFTLR